MEDPRLEPLGRLCLELKGLLAVLDGAENDSGVGIDRAWSHCRIAFEEFQALDGELNSPSAPFPPDVQERVTEVIRLHAIAVNQTTVWMEAVGGERRRVAKARAHLDSLTGDARIGHSCNIAG